MQDVAIFWDYENCSPPSNASGYIVANNIRLIAQAYGSIKSFKAYLEITDQVSSARALALRSEFQSSGVSLIDCPHNGRKEVADKMIIGKEVVIITQIYTGKTPVDMLAYAIDNPAPRSVLVLISGDRDFAYALSILRLRQYQVILVTLSNAHPSLTSQASACVDWHSEIINPVVQPPSRTTNNAAGSVARTALYRDSTPGQSSPSQSSQSTQGTENALRADHGDLLHYLRASTSARPRRPSEVSFNIDQQGRYDRPRQDASPTIEVELRYTRPSLVDKFTTDLVNSSVSNGSTAIHATSDPAQNRNSTLIFGTTDAVAGPTDGQTAFFSLNSNVQPFSASLPKMDPSTPTLLPSIMQETPLGSPAPQYTALETDIPDDDSTCDVPFTYPIRPVSAPRSLPSQSPLAPLISVAEPAVSETAQGLPESQNGAEALSIPLDNPTYHSSVFTSQEMPGQPVYLVIDSSNLSDTPIAIQEETLNNDPTPPDIDSTTESSPFIATDSKSVDQPPITSLVTQASPSFTDSQTTVDESPLITASVSQAETPTSNPQSVVDKPSPSLPSADDCLSRPEVIVPPIFKILVETLNIQNAKGYSRPLRSFIAETMYKNGFTYENTGVTSFGQYTALCEKQGIIELGGSVGGEWISLKPNYENAFKPATPVAPPIYKLLVQTLKLQQSKGFPRASRAIVAYTMYKAGFVYKDADVNRFDQYATLAEKQGIVELGGNEGDWWISLTPEYRNVL